MEIECQRHCSGIRKRNSLGKFVSRSGVHIIRFAPYAIKAISVEIWPTFSRELFPFSLDLALSLLSANPIYLHPSMSQ
jgi:hypothetical protein